MTRTFAVTRIEAAADAIGAFLDSKTAPKPGDDFDTTLARVALAAADAVDPLRYPAKELDGSVPLMLYFGSRADADDFAEKAVASMKDPVEIIV
jgi:hypothetical protein